MKVRSLLWFSFRISVFWFVRASVYYPINVLKVESWRVSVRRANTARSFFLTSKNENGRRTSGKFFQIHQIQPFHHTQRIIMPVRGSFVTKLVKVLTKEREKLLLRIKKCGSNSNTIGFVKWLKMTLYGHFGTTATKAPKYPRGFSIFPIIAYEGEIHNDRHAEEERYFSRGDGTGRICFMQIATLGWPVGATVALAKQQRPLAGRVFAMFFFLAKDLFPLYSPGLLTES